MKKRAFKLLICICVISCLMVGFCTSFASASYVDEVKSTISLTGIAMDLLLHPIMVVMDSPLTQAIDPLGKLDWVETLPEYFEKSTIKVLPDVTQIDGVNYSQIWLGPEAAQSLRLKALDFATAYNILNNQSTAISYATGNGYWDGLPVYSGVSLPSVSISNTTQLVNYPVSAGTYSLGDTTNISLIPHPSLPNRGYYEITGDGLTYRIPSSGYIDLSYHPPEAFSIVNSGGQFYNLNYGGETGYTDRFNGSRFFVSSPFSFDYTSGVIDAPIDPEDGLLIQVPSQYTSQTAPQYNYNIHDLINIYPDIQEGHYVEIDPDLNPDFETDVDLSNDLGLLLHILLSVLDLLDHTEIEFAPEPEPQPQPEPDPSPPPSPVPSIPVSDQPGEWLDQILRWIQETVAQVKHATQTLEDTLQQIKEAVQTLPQQILEDIETAPISIYRISLEIIKTVFAPVLLLLKATIGLWHYVVEWVQATAPVFSSFIGLMNGTSYNMVLPIYASLAGPIVIAVYKRFGK